MPSCWRIIFTMWRSCIRKYWYEIIALGFCSYGLFLRGQKFAERPLYPDELQQINNTLGPLQPFWQRLPMGELSSFPGDYLLLWPMGQLFGNQKWAWAFPHMVASIGLYYVCYLLAKRYFSSVWPLICLMIVVTFNRNLIFHGFEIRPYSVLAFLGVMIFYCMGEWMKGDSTTGLRRWVPPSLGLIAATVFHAYGLLIILCSALFWFLYYRPWNRLPGYLWNLRCLWAVMAVCFVIFAWFASDVNKNNSVESFAGRFITTFQYIPNPLEDGFGFFKNIIGNLLGDKRWYPLLAGLAAIVVSGARWPLLGFFLIMILLPIGLILSSDVMGGYWFLQRQFVWVMPLFAFWLAWSWDALLKMRKSV